MSSHEFDSRIKALQRATIPIEVPPGENPCEYNSVVVSRGLSNILTVCAHEVAPDEYYSISTNIELLLRNGAYKDVSLRLKSRRWANSDSAVLLSLSLNSHAKELAIRDWWVKNEILGYREKIWITSSSDTDRDYEGNGLGIALLRTSDQVIYHTMDHFTRWDSELPVVAQIADMSSGKKRLRLKWSTTQALSLGYRSIGDDIFVKDYR